MSIFDLKRPKSREWRDIISVRRPEAAKADHQTLIVNASIDFQGLANPIRLRASQDGNPHRPTLR
jgi:hypothetical protein